VTTTLVSICRMIELRSELMGSVWHIPVEIGQVLSAGETVAVVESMKMEIPVVAPIDCRILEIQVEEGAQINEGQTIAILAEA
jgi:biotin carboxyl carrier protein